MNIIYQLGAQSLIGMREQDDFRYVVRETPLLADGVSTPGSAQDTDVDAVTGTTSENNFAIDVTDSTLIEGHSFINRTPTVASCDASGGVARIIDGLALIDVSTPVGTRRVSRWMVSNASFAGTYFQGFVAGSLGKHITDAMVALVAGKTADYAGTSLYSSNNLSLSAPAVVRNPSMFASALDWTPISVMNQDPATGLGTRTHPGVLISPRHIIGAAHFRARGPIVWKDSTGAYQTADVTSYASIPGTDIVVQYLSTSITGITPLKVLPSNWATYLPNASGAYNGGVGTFYTYIPVLTKTVHPPGGTWDAVATNYVQMLAFTAASSGAWYAAERAESYVPELDTERFQANIGGGDSGQPLFLLINGELVLFGAYYFASAGEHYGYSTHTTSIEALMNSLAVAQGDMTPYSLSTADLTSFTAY